LQLDPQTVNLTFQTNPAGMTLVVNGGSSKASFTRTVIVGSKNSISAPVPQTKGGKSYSSVTWSDSGAPTHDIIAPSTAQTYSARFR
jgi:hypothetical protein